ncbi:MAG: hypothetical protein P8R04_07250 [Gammaproteobacteria bacterium]|nr:hypothetical protein [Gammaproteobacteria bacterium]
MGDSNVSARQSVWKQLLFEALLGLGFAIIVVVVVSDFALSVPFVYQGL